MKLLSPTEGWALSGDHLLITSDAGIHWRDVTPPKTSASHIENVAFSSPDSGWVLYADLADDEADSSSVRGGWGFHLAHTTNAGQTWTQNNVSLPPAVHDPSGKAVLSFADATHGWLLYKLTTGPAFSEGVLLETSDAGQSWKGSKNGPDFYGDIFAASNKEVWAVGGIGRDDTLAVSRTGGSSFHDVTIPPPSNIGSYDNVEYGLPEFANASDGFIVVAFTHFAANTSTQVLYKTKDRGVTWTVAHVLSDVPGVSVLAYGIGEGHWLLPTRVGTEVHLHKLGDTDQERVSISQIGEPGRCGLSFVSEKTGWMGCGASLMLTTNGGESWREISPRAQDDKVISPAATGAQSRTSVTSPSSIPDAPRATAAASFDASSLSSVGVSQHLGFDTSRVLTVQDMATWWNTSPYFDVGIYLPGGPSLRSDANLTAQWVSSVAAQGWGFIPTWSGLQSPCACRYDPSNPVTTYPGCTAFSHIFDVSPVGAGIQGVQQADSALASAANLGLPGGIIYLDIEQFDSTIRLAGNQGCGVVTQAYLDGWISEMHAMAGAGSAGVYGSPYDTAFFGDADAGWVSKYDDRATVWGLNHGRQQAGENISDTAVWTNHNRLHQYGEQHYEVWGGANHFIDVDIDDGPVVGGGGVKSYTFGTPAAYGPADAVATGIANGTNVSAKNPPPNAGLQLGPALSEAAADEAANDTAVITTSYAQSHYYTTAGQYTMPALPDGSQPYASGINNIGNVVGWACNYNTYPYICSGFLFDRGRQTYRILHVPNAQADYLYSVNDAQWVIGLYEDSSNNQHCVLWKPPFTGPITFDNLGSVSCSSFNGLSGLSQLSINGIGLVAGTSITGEQNVDDSDDATGSIFIDDIENANPSSSDTIRSVAAAPATFTSLNVYGLNNNGQIAGWLKANNTFAPSRGFFINTDYSVAYFDDADQTGFGGINDQNQITQGAYWGPNTYILSPQH